jgi:hypothetical protein
MNLYLMEKMASEHDADLNAQSAHSRPRRRTGWALVSLGLRMAYAAGKE